MSKLRIRQMIGGQVATSVQNFEIPVEYKRNGAGFGSGSLLVGECSFTPKGKILKKTQTLREEILKKSQSSREEILKKTAKIGSPDPDMHKFHKPSLRLSINSQKLKKNLPILTEDWKTFSPKNYYVKDSFNVLSNQDLIKSSKTLINPLLSKTPRTVYKTRTVLLEKTKKSLLSKIKP